MHRVLLSLLLFSCDTTPRGVETIRADDLRKHVETLADDAFGGRDTLGESGDRAAAYVSDHFERLGLSPLPGHETFEVPYTVYARGVDADATSMMTVHENQPMTWRAGTDFRPFPFSDEGAIDAPVVFAGYGISSEEHGWDDYAGLDVRGKWVLVLRHEPRSDDPHAAFGGAEPTEHSLFRTKVQVAKAHGAAGMLLVSDPKTHQDAEDFRLTPRLRLDDTEPSSRSPGPRGEDQPFLSAHLSQEAAERFLLPSGRSLASLQHAVDAGTPPRRLALGTATARLELARDPEPVPVQDHNVIAWIEGRRADEWVLVGAHYDHLGSFPGGGDTVYNGADDNASGTAAVLELAAAFAGQQPERSLVFALFSGEERGLLGSRAAVRDNVLPADKTVFMLNLDMIGRKDAGGVSVIGDGYVTDLKMQLEQLNQSVDLPLEFQGTQYSGASDHDSFYRKDVPFAFLFSGLHDDYHQLSDHADKLDYAQIQGVTRLGYGLMDRIASDAWTPRFVFRVAWLGVTAQVIGEHATLTEVHRGSRGDLAGLAVGDRLEAFNGVGLDDPREIGATFRDIEPGAIVPLGILREGKPRTVEILRARTGYLGVFPTPVEHDVRQRFGLADTEGVLLSRVVPDGPAHSAGLVEGDIVYRLGGYPVSGSSLSAHLARIGAGEEVQVDVLREGERLSMALVLGERPDRG